MKKQFFYAALAIGMMSSCSSNDLPGNQAPEEQLPEEEKVAIELGASPLNAVVTTRGAGFAGNQNDGDAAYWDKQELGILMVNKIKASDVDPGLWKAMDGTEYIFKGLTFSAPDDATTQVGTTKITNNEGRVCYYPLQGAFDFYGWHFDDAQESTPIDIDTWTGTTDELNPVKSLESELTINGTQDIMVGFAELTNPQKAQFSADITGGMSENDAYERAYSSWAARRSVQPYITFKHLLARLDFRAILGEDLTVVTTDKITVDANYDTDYETESEGGIYPDKDASNQIDNGVYVKSIEVLAPNDKFTVVVADVDPDNLGIKASTPTQSQPGDPKNFTLQRKPTASEITDGSGLGKKMRKLLPVNAGYKKNTESELTNTDVPVGDGILIVPGESQFRMRVVLMQYVPVVDQNDATDPSVVTNKYKWKEASMETDVKLASGTFVAGKYYTVNVKIYGFQKIEVNAVLQQWQEGSDIDSNPEDENF